MIYYGKSAVQAGGVFAKARRSTRKPRGHSNTSTSSTAAIRYTYNAAGDVVYDQDKGLTYSYNALGLVSQVLRADGTGLQYRYAADGTLVTSTETQAAAGGGVAVSSRMFYLAGDRHDAMSGETYVHTPFGATLLDAGLSAKHVGFHADHLGNIILAYSDLNGDGFVDPSTEVLEENRYYPYGLKLPVYTRQSTALPFAYNGAEEQNSFGLHLTTYRTLAPEVAFWGQVDPKAEWDYASSPYASMRGNPISQADADGDFAFVPILIGMAVGAALHTGGHLIQNKGTFNNWNWGAFAASTVAGGVSGGVGNALKVAQIGGVAGGAILGASSSAAYGLVRAPLDKTYTWGDAAKGFAIGTLTGAAIGGVDAAIKGQNIWDGSSKVSQQRFQTAEGDLVMKDGDYYGFENESRLNTTSPIGSEGAPTTRTIEINKGFKRGLTADLDITPGGGTYSISVDGHEMLSTTGRLRTTLQIPKGARSITFGFTDVGTRAGTQVGNVVTKFYSTPTSWTQLHGQWRGFGGFLFF